MVSKNISTINKNTESLFHFTKEVGLEVTTEKNYRFIPHHQNAGQDHNIKPVNTLFENVAT
jgi:hypothetical protein